MGSRRRRGLSAALSRPRWRRWPSGLLCRVVPLCLQRPRCLGLLGRAGGRCYLECLLALWRLWRRLGDGRWPGGRRCRCRRAAGLLALLLRLSGSCLCGLCGLAAGLVGQVLLRVSLRRVVAQLTLQLLACLHWSTPVGAPRRLLPLV
jgi:hypothetical protein